MLTGEEKEPVGPTRSSKVKLTSSLQLLCSADETLSPVCAYSGSRGKKEKRSLLRCLNRIVAQKLAIRLLS